MFSRYMKINKHLNISEKHILIIGNRSYKNMGDELILLWTTKLLLDEEKKITIAAYNPQWLEKFFSQFIDTSKITFVTEIPKWFRSRIRYIREGKLKEWKLWKKANAVIIGWGEIITEENRHSYRYRLVSLLPILRTPRYLMGGIQKPKKLFNRLLFTKILKRTKHIFARDTDTIHELKNYGFNDVEFFMDTSYFAYKWNSNRSPLSRGDAKGRGVQPSKKYIVINVNKNAEQFLPDIIEDVKHRYKKWYEIFYVPVAKGKGEIYDDKAYAHKIQRASMIKDQQFSILDREEDFGKFAKILAWASIVISSRLHLFLIASFLGVPTKAYPYQKKILKMQKIVKDISNKTDKKIIT